MRRGFTLIELLVVIAIIAILMAALMPAFTTANDRARVTECRAHIAAIGIALDQYRRDRGGNPPDLQALCDRGYLTDDSLLLCSKTGARYFYDKGAKSVSGVICACCAPGTAKGKRPHSGRESFVVIQAGGKLVEVGS